MIVVFSRHELIHELVRSLNDFVYLLYLFLLHLFVVIAVEDSLVFAVLLDGPAERVSKGIRVWLFDRGIVEGESKRFDRIHVWEYVDVLS